MKYIIIKSANTHETALVFSPVLKHIEMLPDGFTAVAAGFCLIRGVGADAGNEKSLHIECWGGSESLHVFSRQIDADIVRRDVHWPD